jgi:hypothetical protein
MWITAQIQQGICIPATVAGGIAHASICLGSALAAVVALSARTGQVAACARKNNAVNL